MVNSSVELTVQQHQTANEERPWTILTEPFHPQRAPEDHISKARDRPCNREVMSHHSGKFRGQTEYMGNHYKGGSTMDSVRAEAVSAIAGQSSSYQLKIVREIKGEDKADERNEEE